MGRRTARPRPTGRRRRLRGDGRRAGQPGRRTLAGLRPSDPEGRIGSGSVDRRNGSEPRLAGNRIRVGHGIPVVAGGGGRAPADAQRSRRMAPGDDRPRRRRPTRFGGRWPIVARTARHEELCRRFALLGTRIVAGRPIAPRFGRGSTKARTATRHGLGTGPAAAVSGLPVPHSSTATSAPHCPAPVPRGRRMRSATTGRRGPGLPAGPPATARTPRIRRSAPTRRWSASNTFPHRPSPPPADALSGPERRPAGETGGAVQNAPSAVGQLAARPAEAVAAPGAPAPAASPAAVADQIVSVVVPLHGRGDGRHEVTLELRPDDLGAIRVEVSVEHQTVHLDPPRRRPRHRAAVVGRPARPALGAGRRRAHRRPRRRRARRRPGNRRRRPRAVGRRRPTVRPPDPARPGRGPSARHRIRPLRPTAGRRPARPLPLKEQR